LLDEFNGYQDPDMLIPEFITKLTGITDDMVRGQSIDESEVAKYFKEVDIIIAHNAQFDRGFFETTFPSIPVKSWACSMRDINWKEEDISSFKLEYIAYRYNFFYEGHRAIIDCLAGIHILAQTLFTSKQLALKSLLDNALELRFKLWAVNAPYDCKELLKARGYKWVMGSNNTRAWCVELPEREVEDEIKYLRSDIYQSAFDIPIEVLDSRNRFSVKEDLVKYDQYADKILWAKILCKE
jgi:DNA polymerase-3 subunit epsilon